MTGSFGKRPIDDLLRLGGGFFLWLETFRQNLFFDDRVGYREIGVKLLEVTFGGLVFTLDDQRRAFRQTSDDLLRVGGDFLSLETFLRKSILRPPSRVPRDRG